MVAILICSAVYTLTGLFLGKWYWQRRHGLYIKVINGGYDALFTSVSLFIWFWPIMLLFPNFRNPTLCECRDHVLKRAQIRQENAAYQRALGEQ